MENIEEQHWFTNKQIVALIGFVIFITFSATAIYYRFVVVEQELKEMNDRVEYVNERLTRHIAKTTKTGLK